MSSGPTLIQRVSVRWRTGLFLLVVVAFPGTLIVQSFLEWRARQIERDVDAATGAIDQFRFQEAESLSAKVLRQSSTHPAALLIAARCAAAEREWNRAYAFCDRMTASERKKATRSLLALGKELVEKGEARRAEEILKLTLHLDPRNSDAAFVLAFVFACEGRAWEAAPLIRTLVNDSRCDVPQLLIVSASDEFFINQPEFLKRCRQARPDDPLPLLVDVRNAMSRNESQLAGSILQRLVASDPWLVEAQARWGLWLLDQNQDEQFLEWHRKLPAEADAHPETWVARGLWALRKNQPRAAIRCFGEGVRLDPNLRIAHFHLARLLGEAGQHELSERFQTRTQLLSELRVPLGTIMQQRDVAILQRIVQLLEELGRPREALAWTELFLRDADGEWARELVDRIRTQFPNERPWITESQRLSDQIDFTKYPLPTWESGNSTPSASPVVSKSDSMIRFREDAERLGIQFQYDNDAKDPENALRMFEFSGGGLVVLDYDGDGWPDLYATQGGQFPRQPGVATHVDCLFRNPGRGTIANVLSDSSPAARFHDVTSPAGLGDPQYSQGAAAGDIDQDGFPDLYVANIGPNRIYRNNGDGTFADITPTTTVIDDDWTTSCLVADLNGDTLPDLFAVNYLTAPDIYTRICESGGVPRQCPPATFEPQQDRVWINRGDGEFGEHRSALVSEKTSGRGLGVLATRSDRPGLLNVFIANDTDPNFWYVNLTDSATGQLQLEEQAVAGGLAFDGSGNPQACMGIAAGDVDRNGLIDFFVTNFYREANTLYLQQPGGLFLDQTRKAGLRDPSFLMLGFGTQFLDADADGWLDLVITNGHVYNNAHLGEPWKMSPQFFRNTGQGQFVELAPRTVGPWFAGQYLGRSLVHWDWNRDCHPDFAVSHADVPLAVLTNLTETSNHSLSLTLHGVKSNRDAIGTMINITAGTEKSTHWLNAGDGFQSSNDRRLVIGLGQKTVADEITIHWPSGDSQILKDVSADHEWIVVEGRPPLVRQE